MQPDITKMLGGEDAPQQENPLENIDEAMKGSNKKPSEAKSDTLDEATIRELLMTGDNSEGLFTPEEDKEEEKEDPKHAEIHEEAIVKTKSATPKGKYIKKFKEDMLKNPEAYKVQTPKGEMTITEAMRKGYNPITKRFEKDKSPEEIKKRNLEGLNDADRQAIEELTNPAAAKVAPKDAEAMGLPSDSPMINSPMPGQPTGIPTQVSPDAVPPQQAGSPEGLPGNEGVDLAAMLGGAR